VGLSSERNHCERDCLRPPLKSVLGRRAVVHLIRVPRCRPGHGPAGGMVRLARLVVPGLPHHITQRGNRRRQTFFREDDYAAYVERMAEWCGQRGVEVWAYCLMPNHVHLIRVPQSEDGLARAIGEAHRRYTRRINFREGWRGYLLHGRFASFLMIPEEELRDLREHARTGCPLGDATFLQRLEKAAGRVLRPRKAGRPPNYSNAHNRFVCPESCRCTVSTLQAQHGNIQKRFY
jgi:REP element-mobilizing transposase RayT